MSLTQLDLYEAPKLGGQAQAIFKWLRAGNPIDHFTAERHFGCTRLAARIHDIKRQGHKIDTHWHSRAGKRWASYTLEEVRYLPFTGEEVSVSVCACNEDATCPECSAFNQALEGKV